MGLYDKHRRSITFSNGSSISLIPLHELHELPLYKGSWFSRVKSICNLHVFFFSRLYFLFMNWYGKYRRSVKYNNGSSIFLIPFHECMCCVCTRGSWFSHVKTICKLDVFFYSLLYFLFMNWYWKYRRSVKYINGSSIS